MPLHAITLGKFTFVFDDKPQPTCRLGVHQTRRKRMCFPCNKIPQALVAAAQSLVSKAALLLTWFYVLPSIRCALLKGVSLSRQKNHLRRSLTLHGTKMGCSFLGPWSGTCGCIPLVELCQQYPL